jgi:hypothetical protein
LGFGAAWQARPEADTDGVGLAGVVGCGMGATWKAMVLVIPCARNMFDELHIINDHDCVCSAVPGIIIVEVFLIAMPDMLIWFSILVRSMECF